MFSVSQLDADQRASIVSWVEEGADLSLIQKRLLGEYEISLTYMDTRFLISDLGLTIREEAEAQPEEEEEAVVEDVVLEDETTGVKVHVDGEPIPGTMVSGFVTFSDGEKGMWYIDQEGSPGLQMDKPDYQPSAADIEVFQTKLRGLLEERGSL